MSCRNSLNLYIESGMSSVKGGISSKYFSVYPSKCHNMPLTGRTIHLTVSALQSGLFLEDRRYLDAWRPRKWPDSLYASARPMAVVTGDAQFLGLCGAKDTRDHQRATAFTLLRSRRSSS